MARWLADLVPRVSEWIADTKLEVREAAQKAMQRVATDAMDNDDVRPLLPALLSSMTNPDEVLECIFKLASTTFVQTVTCAPLALIAPLLVRGLGLQLRARGALLGPELLQLEHLLALRLLRLELRRERLPHFPDLFFHPCHAAQDGGLQALRYHARRTLTSVFTCSCFPGNADRSDHALSTTPHRAVRLV